MVQHKKVAKNTVSTSTPKKDRNEMLFGKVVSNFGAENTIEKSLSKDNGIENWSTKSLITVLRRLKNSHSGKDGI